MYVYIYMEKIAGLVMRVALCAQSDKTHDFIISNVENNNEYHYNYTKI
jgi:hypothetical protein